VKSRVFVDLRSTTAAGSRLLCRQKYCTRHSKVSCNMSQFGSSALSASWSCYHLSFWMYILYFISGMFLVISSKFPGMAGNPTPARSQGMRTYTEPYSLGENYSLDPRLDWQSVNVTDFQYKHRHNPTNDTQQPVPHSHHSGVTGTIEGALEGVWNGLKGIGKPQDVTITW